MPHYFIITVCLSFILSISEVSGFDKIVNLATHESPPYSGGKLENKGVLAEIVAAAFKKEGYIAKISVVPWKRALNGTKTGVYDGLFGRWYRKNREKWFMYSSLLISNEFIFLKRRESNLSFNGDYSILKHYRIGYIRGYANPPGIESIKDSIKIEMVTDSIQNLKKLEAGRLDLIMIDRILFRYLIKTDMRKSDGVFEEINYILMRDTNYLAFSKKSEGFQSKRKAFNRGMGYLKKERIIEKILKRHGL